jgi:haloalkane dehalogenase
VQRAAPLSGLFALLLAACSQGEAGEVLRTPEERFASLPGFPYAPRYQEIRGLRIHYVDEGPRDAAPVLLLHGEPTWSYLYRTMIPGITAAGYRAVAPDLVGFGRSDKLARREDYSYQLQVDVMAELVRRLDLREATLFCQDWGGLVGLRVVAEMPERFAAVVAANTGLPAPEQGQRPPLAFRIWRSFARWTPVFPAGRIVDTGSRTKLSPAVRAAYDAPFPTRRHQAGARAMPALVPTTPDDPAVPANRRAWEALRRFEKPFVTAFSDGDPITRGLEAAFQREIPGARGQPHTTIRGAGHFLQEDKGEELAALVVDLLRRLETGRRRQERPVAEPVPARPDS